MTTKNSTTHTKTDEEWADQVYTDLMSDEQPVISLDDMDEIEHSWESLRRSRRCLLAFGTKPWKEIAKSIQEDREFAVAAAATVSCSNQEFYDRLSELVSAVKGRLEVALCCREDMKEIMEEADQDIERLSQEEVA